MCKNTILDLVRASDMEVKYTKVEMEILLGITVMHDKDRDMLDAVLEELNSNSPIIMMFNKRVEVFDLQNKIDKYICNMLVAYNIGNPGQAMLLLIMLLDYYDTYDKPCTIKELVTKVCPYGFYDIGTSSDIIDRFIKTKKASNHYIY